MIIVPNSDGSRPARLPRRGVVLVLYVPLFFGMMGLAALVIDMSLVRIERQRMQSAVDSAALEALRQGGSPDGRDFAAAIADMAHPPAQPEIALGDSFDDSTGLNPGQLLSVRTSTARGMQANPDNRRHGDIVRGTFVNPDQSMAEGADYVNNNLTPTNTGGDAVLARLRRTDDRDGLDDEAGISSNRSTLPLLFGRGTLIQARQNANDYSVRHDGFAVRATAIAQGRPAATVGRARPDADPSLRLFGSATFALERSAWESLFVPDTPVVLTADGTSIRLGAVVVGNGISSRVWAIGMPVDRVAGVVGDGPSAYVPIVDAAVDAAAGGRVVGFGWIDIVGNAVTARRNRVAPHNAAVTFVPPSGISEADFNQMWAAHKALKFPLLGAALVR